MPTVALKEASSEEDILAVRRLMRDYGDYLANSPSGAASICLTGYEQELRSLPEGYTAIFLAEVDGVPAGCVALRAIIQGERACEMKRLWVASGFRALGLGRRLVEQAIAWATNQGFQSIYLDTVPAAMPEAGRLYASLGFVPVERYNQNPLPGVEFFYRPLGNVR